MAKRPDCPECGKRMLDAVEGARVVASVCECGYQQAETGLYLAYAPWQLKAWTDELAERAREVSGA